MNFRPVILAVLLTANCMAGVIVTNEGTRFEGDVQRADGGWKITGATGKTNFVPAANVKSIELSGGSTSSNAAEGLQSLRRSVEASDDLAKIIERFKKFIEQTSDVTTAAAARDDLATWQDRLDRHLVKIGKQWVTPEEKASLDAAASAAAQNARLLMKAGNTKEAAELLDAAQQNGGNISVLYLQGVLADAHGDPAAAKKAFLAVQQVVPDHPPTLLNLAVLAMRQKQWAAAAGLLDQALAAAPGVQSLIDAAAELLAAMPDDQRKSTAALKLANLFGDQDAQLQKKMSARKLFRWGSTWVDQPTMDKITEAEAAAKKKVADLQGDFNLTQGRIQRIDSESADNNRAMRDMEAHSWVATADGTYVRAPLPTAYYELQRQNTQLHGEKVEMTNRLDALRDAAKRAKDDMPVPKFSGKISMIGEDGMPVIMPPAPASAAANQNVPPPPATQPPASQPEPPYIKIGPARAAE